MKRRRKDERGREEDEERRKERRRTRREGCTVTIFSVMENGVSCVSKSFRIVATPKIQIPFIEWMFGVASIRKYFDTHETQFSMTLNIVTVQPSLLHLFRPSAGEGRGG
jgi:hypothetical protein